MRSFLVPQSQAGVDGALDIRYRLYLPVRAVPAGFAPLLDEHQDVVDVDLDLLDELDLEDDVVGWRRIRQFRERFDCAPSRRSLRETGVWQSAHWICQMRTLMAPLCVNGRQRGRF
jgi:hypothetical protein